MYSSGDEDKIIPVQQTETGAIHPTLTSRFSRAGHLVHLERREAVEALGKLWSPIFRSGRAWRPQPAGGRAGGSLEGSGANRVRR